MTTTEPAAGRTRVGRLDPEAAMAFTRDSAIRRIVSEPVTGLVLQHVLVLDVAHVKVGAGVQEHSEFRHTPYRRIWTTMDAALRLVFGDDAVSRQAARQVYRFHDHINGPLPEPNPAFPEGGRYTAHDATLLLWVWATLVSTPMMAVSRWLGPIPPHEADAFYADMASFARFFGIPEDLVPPDRRAFDEYYEGVLDGPALVPTDTSRKIVHDVLWFPNPIVPPALVRPLRVLSVGTLDRRVRERFDLTLDARDQRLFERLDSRLKATYRYRPAWLLRRLPELYVAARTPILRFSKV